MLTSSPTNNYFSRRCTPPRLFSTPSDPASYDSPMLTPSPLRQRPLCSTNLSNGLDDDADDLFLQSPYKSPVPTHHFHSFAPSKLQPVIPDDDEGSIFLSPSSPFLATSPSQPLRTPIKQFHNASNRSALAVKQMNILPCPPSGTTTPTTRVGVGTKRKSTPHVASTPIRQHNLTPLMISKIDSPFGSDNVMLDRLAPLPAPKFTAAVTPRTNAETDAYLRRQTASLTRLSLTDLNDSGEEFGGINNDSGCEIDDEERSTALFTGSVRTKSKSTALGRATVQEIYGSKSKGKEKEEVVEAISPGGHITKRRARSRPVSAELLESVQRSPPSPRKYASPVSVTAYRQRNSSVIFPSVSSGRKQFSSPSPSPELGSPLPRRRVTNMHPHPLKPLSSSQSLASRPSLSREENLSAASLFFGPIIPEPSHFPPEARSRTNTTLTSSTPGTPGVSNVQHKTMNRHSYAGPGGSKSLQLWKTIQTREVSPSPRSSPPVASKGHDADDYEQELFFGGGPQDSSFVFSVTEGTPSPRSKRTEPGTLPRKYKPPRDSGVVMTDDEDDNMSTSEHLNIISTASTSASSIQSDTEDNLITPGLAPEVGSGWPHVFVTGTDDIRCGEHLDVDAFIVRTLAAATKGPPDTKKKVPGTPVKRIKTTYLTGGVRPWQSAVAAKIGLRFDGDVKKGKAPRQSLPAAFPGMRNKTAKVSPDQVTDSEDDEESPGRRNKYIGLGLGRPSPQDGLMSRARLLVRRSSSGAISSGSESISSSGTPTRIKGKDWHRATPHVPAQLINISPVRSASGSSSSSVATLNSPSIPSSRRFPISSTRRPATQRTISVTRRFSEPFSEEQSGRFERDFVEEDELGSGEFGKVIKVHCKNSDDHEVYAVKKSKRFEGTRHRLRLREEVEILQHLSQVAAYAPYEQNRHPNVLAYIDSWEEDEALYIRTELCASGNLAQFLWEFGRAYPKLGEDRVWKTIVDLSNGLRFIHDAGVIHLDLKPSNIFVTGEGRLKIGDFGMASLWPRPNQFETTTTSDLGGGFEREGDKLYLAPEVLQGRYSKAADMFSFGMTILEAASNIVVPDQGEAWHRLRREDFSQIDLDESPQLLDMIKQMMRTDPALRISVHAVCDHPVVSRARAIMERVYVTAKNNGTSLFAASPLGSMHRGFLEEILNGGKLESGVMDVSL